MEASSILGSSVGTTGSGQALGNLTDNFDTFLLLLTTQLQNQDPTSPLDTNDFTEQLVQFTGVEQQIATNTKLDELVNVFQTSQVGNVVSFTGKGVEIEGDTFVLPENEPIAFSYTLDSSAEETFISIRDASGSVVFNAGGQTEAGRHNALWDGTDNNGNKVAPGAYTVAVTSRAPGSEAVVELPTLVNGIVTGVNLDGDDITLLVDNQLTVDINDVKFVGAPLRVTAAEQPSNETTETEDV